MAVPPSPGNRPPRLGTRLTWRPCRYSMRLHQTYPPPAGIRGCVTRFPTLLGFDSLYEDHDLAGPRRSSSVEAGMPEF